VVAEQWKYPGESVRSGEPILRIQRMDQLEFRVELSDRMVAPEHLGDLDAEILFHADSDAPIAMQGVAFDRVMPSNLDDEHYYAIARIVNEQVRDARGELHWRLRPGMSGKVRLHERPEQEQPPTKKWISTPKPFAPHNP
jgi:hypothetical protein